MTKVVRRSNVIVKDIRVIHQLSVAYVNGSWGYALDNKLLLICEDAKGRYPVYTKNLETPICIGDEIKIACTSALGELFYNIDELERRLNDE